MRRERVLEAARRRGSGAGAHRHDAQVAVGEHRQGRHPGPPEVGRRDGWSASILRKNDETTEAQRQGFAKAVRAGARIAFGTDAGVFPHGLNARQFKYMVRYGMTPLQAIQSATTVAAEFLGWSKDVGSLTPGHYADMIALKRNPLEDVSVLEQVEHVIKGGIVVR